LTIPIWRAAYVKRPIETAINEESMYIFISTGMMLRSQHVLLTTTMRGQLDVVHVIRVGSIRARHSLEVYISLAALSTVN